MLPALRTLAVLSGGLLAIHSELSADTATAAAAPALREFFLSGSLLQASACGDCQCWWLQVAWLSQCLQSQ